jgi:hypothetical protein
MRMNPNTDNMQGQTSYGKSRAVENQDFTAVITVGYGEKQVTPSQLIAMMPS